MCQRDKLPKFKERMNELLIYSGKTVVDFAKQIGISRQSLGYYLNGERIPDADTLKQICSACNVSSDYLLGLSDVRIPNPNIRAISDFTGLNEDAVLFLYSMCLQNRVFDNNSDDINLEKPKLDTINLLLDNDYGRTVLRHLSTFLYSDFDKPFDENGKPIGKLVFFPRNDKHRFGLPIEWVKIAVLDNLTQAVKELKTIIEHEENTNGKP